MIDAPLHVVRRRLATGDIVEYVYAFRGGPRLTLPREDVAFDAHRARLITEWQRRSGARAAKSRIDREAAEFADNGEPTASVRAVARALLKNARYRAARRRVPCELSLGMIYRMLIAQQMRCAVSGLPFDTGFNAARQHSRNPYSPSIDRLNNAKGYVPGNIRVVLTVVNYGINEWGLDAYVRVCRAVADLVK